MSHCKLFVNYKFEILDFLAIQKDIAFCLPQEKIVFMIKNTVHIYMKYRTILTLLSTVKKC